MRCPCRKKSDSTTYEACCQPYHLGVHIAATAEALMRSRYSAFVQRNAAYVSATWHPSTRPQLIDFEVGQTWVALQVIATTANGDTATVQFTARSLIRGQSHLLKETSRFVREGGRWTYVDGVVG
jgi:SEC-C motif domain protein